MKHSKHRLTRLVTTVASFALAWWLFELAGYWSHAPSLTQFLCFSFCLLGIDRVLSGVADLVTIAFAPIETLKHHQ